MDYQGSFKDLEDVVIKSTYQMEVDGKIIEPGETIARFDKIQMAVLQENKSLVSAKGGYKNAPRVFWEDTKEVQLSFSQGVFSKIQFALMNNLNLLKRLDSNPIFISNRETVGVEIDGASLLFETSKEPARNMFVYDEDTLEKVQYHNDVSKGTKNFIVDIGNPKNLILDYDYLYEGNSSSFMVGQTLTNGFVSLQGKTRIKLDDENGTIKNAILNIPKLKLRSSLSMRLGADAIPYAGSFNAIACPTGGKGTSYVMELLTLED